MDLKSIYKEWVDSLLEECTDANRVKGKDLEIITSTIPENMGTEVYKLGEKSDNLLYVYIKRNEEGGVYHLYVYKEIAKQPISIEQEQPLSCYYNTANQQGEKEEMIVFSARDFVVQYYSSSNKVFFYCKDVTETSEQNSSEESIDIDKIIDKLPTEFKDLYCRIGKLHLCKKITSKLRDKEPEQEGEQVGN